MARESYALVHYDADDTFSVISTGSKNIIEWEGDTVKVKWPQGVYQGNIIKRSGMYYNYPSLCVVYSKI